MKITDDLLVNDGLQGIRALPKGEAHSHGVLAAQIDDLRTITGSTIPEPPARFGSLEAFLEYARTYVLPLYTSPERIFAIFEKVFQSLIRDGVSVAELSFDAMMPVTARTEWQTLIPGFQDLISKYSHLIRIVPEIGFAREISRSKWRQQIKDAFTCDFFRCCDLYGAELSMPIEEFLDYFASARERGMKIKLHTGEFAPPDRVLHEINVVKPHAVQHGISAVGHTQCEELIRDLEIVLNMCPTSNVHLGAVRTLDEHPIRRAVRSGLKVTIGTDDYTTFQRSLSEEYLALFDAQILTAHELEMIRLQSLKI